MDRNLTTMVVTTMQFDMDGSQIMTPIIITIVIIIVVVGEICHIP
jgi:hypothetical protein